MTVTVFRQGSELADGRYVLERRLGAGGMATVWLALDTRLARQVAIKLPSDALSADETFARRFEREAQTAAALSHPNLVAVFDYGSEGERPYLVSEYIDGASLAQLRERGRPPETEDLARTLLEALAHIHAAGIVHRDVKPANVLVDRQGRILLTDFGIAQSTEETSLTATGQLIGTLSYIAPEVKRGERAGPASDLYACGVVLSEQLSAADPDRLARLVDALLQEELADRPRSAELAFRLLERQSVEVATTATIEAPQRTRPFPLPPEPARQAPNGFRPKPAVALAVLAAVAAIAVIAVTALGGGGGNGTDDARVADSGAAAAGSTQVGAGGATGLPAASSAPDPDRGFALNERGKALLDSGDIAGAVPVLERAVASYPTDSTDINYAYALFNYGQALRLAGDPAAAIPVLEKRATFGDQPEAAQAELELARKAAGEG